MKAMTKVEMGKGVCNSKHWIANFITLFVTHNDFLCYLIGGMGKQAGIDEEGKEGERERHKQILVICFVFVSFIVVLKC